MKLNNWWRQYSAAVASGLSIAAIVTMIGLFYTVRLLVFKYDNHIKDFEKFEEKIKNRSEKNEDIHNFLWNVDGAQNEMIFKISRETGIDISKERKELPKPIIRSGG